MDNAHDRLNENSSLTSNNINTEQKENRNGVALNGHSIKRRTSYRPGDKVPLSCLDLKVVYVRVSRYDIDDTIPEYLRLNCIPLNHDTLLQVNGVGSSVSTDGISTLLRRDRFDKKTEEVTFVNTDSIRMTRSVKFEVFHNGIPMISGVIDLSYSNRSLEELKNQEPRWGMNCESKVGTGLFTVKRSTRHESPEIEVYIAGCFSGNPIIVTKTLQLSSRKNLSRKAMLKSIPEYEAADSSEQDVASTLSLQVTGYSNYIPENEEYNYLHPRMEYLESEDVELSGFKAGLRVGVGIGLTVCLAIGIGVNLLVHAYQGTTRNVTTLLF